MKALKVMAILLIVAFSVQAADAQVRRHHRRHHKVVRHHHHQMKRHR